MCAGLASVFALFALGAFYVYFLPLAPRMKAVLLLSTVPIAIFVNLVRIILTSVLAYYVGPVTLEMVFHRFSGTTTFLLALALLVGLAEYVRKKWPASAQTGSRASAAPLQPDNAANANMDWKSFGLGAALFIGALLISLMLNGGRNMALPGAGFSDLPMSSGEFAVSQIDWQHPYEDPKADDFASRIYIGPGTAPIEVFLGYKGSQSANERLRSPKLIVGDDWNFVWVNPVRLDMGRSAQLEANWMLVRSGKDARLVLYWYQFGHRSEASELGYRINLAKRLVFERRSDAAVVRLATPILPNEPIEKAQERLSAFATHLYPKLLRILPE
jgi:EpsI family protein